MELKREGWKRMEETKKMNYWETNKIKKGWKTKRMKYKGGMAKEQNKKKTKRNGIKCKIDGNELNTREKEWIKGESMERELNNKERMEN